MGVFFLKGVIHEGKALMSEQQDRLHGDLIGSNTKVGEVCAWHRNDIANFLCPTGRNELEVSPDTITHTAVFHCGLPLSLRLHFTCHLWSVV